MNLYRISKIITLKTLPVLLCTVFALLMLPSVSVKDVQVIKETCEDRRLIMLEQRHRDCSLLAEFFYEGEGRILNEPNISQSDKAKAITETRTLQDALLVQLGCIYQEEIRISNDF